MSYRDGMRERMIEAIELHQPDNAALHCAGCAAVGELEDWPCDEVRYAVMVEQMYEDRVERRGRPA